MKTNSKMAKRILSLLLTLLMVLSLVPVSVFSTLAAEVETVAVGSDSYFYDGVPVTPEKISSSNYQYFGLTDSNWSAYNGYYGIRDAKELYGFANLVNGGDRYVNAVLLHDIVVNETVSSSGATYEWVPIGASSGTSFMGTFDGNGCTISGLYCNYITATGVGLFGTIGASAQINSVNVKNIVLANSYISGSNGVGGIVGRAIGYGSTISNCVVSEDVMVVKSIDSATPYTGGIIGNYGGLMNSTLQMYKVCCIVSNCVNLGTVQIMTFDFTSNLAANRHNIGSITGAYATEDNAFEFIEVNNCYYLSGHMKDKNGNTLKADGTVVNIGKGGGSNRLSSRDCTILSSASDSHTCVSVEHKEVLANCKYQGCSAYTFCIICGKVLSGSISVTNITDEHVFVGGTCLKHTTCRICGKESDELNPDNHESTQVYYKPNATDNTMHDVIYDCCDAVKETIPHDDGFKYTPNADNKQKHDITYLCCGALYLTESHTFTDSSICDFCGAKCSHIVLKDGVCVDCGSIGVDYLYREWDGTKIVEETRTSPGQPQAITSSDSNVSIADGWYIVNEDASMRKLIVSGKVHLILSDRAKLSITWAGVEVTDGSELYIYAQSADPDVAGSLYIESENRNNGITILSGAKVVINGGNITALGDKYQTGIGGSKELDSTLIINGGVITAKGDEGGSGIGGTHGHNGINVTINDGIVTAEGGRHGAGIGSGSGNTGSYSPEAGSHGGNIVINGGKVTAIGGRGGAGIGGGSRRYGGTIVINGGEVYAACSSIEGPGIGGGSCAGGGSVTITGGTVTAIGGDYAAGIGGGYDGKGADVVITGGNVKVLKASNVTANIGPGYSSTIPGTLKDGKGNDIYLNLITLDGVTEQTAVTKIEGVTDYGLKDVKTIDTNMLYFYLPQTDNLNKLYIENDLYSGVLEGTTEKSGTFTLHTKHNWEDGKCPVCGAVCEHNFNNGFCTECGAVCEHNWDDGVCTICGAVCEHEWENSVCTICGKVCEHNWDDGVCTICGKACEHNWDEGICTICGDACEHNWDDGICSICGTVCEHNWENGVCTNCSKECEHSWQDGVCTVCSMICEHEWSYGSCVICGVDCNHPHCEAEFSWSEYPDGTCYAGVELTCTVCNYYADSYSRYVELDSETEAVDCMHPGSRTYSLTYEYNGETYSGTKTFEVKSYNHIGELDNGFCSECGGYEAAAINDNGTPDDEYDDYYEISNAGQLYWFREVAVAKDSYSNAVLTADIIVNEDLDAENLREWISIGDSSSTPYTGSFNGQGHYISGLYAKSELNYIGLFGAIGWGATVSNLGVKNSYFEGNYYVAGIAGYSDYSYVINCYAENVEIVAVSSGAALVGYNYGEVSNSYSTSDLLVGNNNYGTITNCYYLADEETDYDDGTTAMSADQFASGEVAYLLQAAQVGEPEVDENGNYIYDEDGNLVYDTESAPHVWGQKIGTDEIPVLGGDKVYSVTNCKNEIAYSNKNENGQHNFVDGTCTNCGESQPVEKVDNLAGYTIGLGDKIAVNYYMSLTEKTLNDANTKMVFTVPDTGSTYTLEIPVSEAVKSGDYYVFTCEVAAKEMTSVIKAKLVTSETELTLDDYSVQRYAEYILAEANKANAGGIVGGGDNTNIGNSSNTDSTNQYVKAAPVVKKMLNYGAEAQIYFDYNTDNLANDTEHMTEEEKVTELYGFAGAGFTLEGEEAGVTYYGSTLALKSELAIKHYFVIDESVDVNSLEIVCDYPVTLAKNGSLYELKISDIPAHQVATDITVQIGSINFTYSIASYGAIAQSNGNTALWTIVSALAAYSFEAIGYMYK